MQLFSVYVPTNHIYVGDVFLLGKQDIIKVNLSVREGLGKLHQPGSSVELHSLLWSCRQLALHVLYSSGLFAGFVC